MPILTDSDDLPEDLRTIGPKDLGILLGRSEKMIKVDAWRRPDTLPRRFIIPGTRKLLWRLGDVREWMNALAEIEALRRAASIEFQRKHKIKGAPATGKFTLGPREQGDAITRHMVRDGKRVK